MAKVRKYVWRIILLILGLIASLAVVAVFSVRAIGYAPHRLVEDPIRPWMSLPYIAHSYKVPSYVLYEALGLVPILHDRRPITHIARELNLPDETVVAKLQEAIIHSRPPYPTPLPATPPIPTPGNYPQPKSP